MNNIPFKITAIICLSLLINTATQANWQTVKSNPPYTPTKLSPQLMKNHVVQFLSSQSAEKAEGIKNTLMMHGFPAFVKTHDSQGTSLYQVQIGPFNSHFKASNAKLRVIHQYPQYGFLKDAIVKTKL